MSFDFLGYIKFSDQLLNDNSNFSDPQAVFRAAMSRYYYGVFIPAREWLIGQGRHVEGKGDHTSVADKYKNSGKPGEKKVGRNLERLLVLRVNADYKYSTVGLNDAQDAQALANKLRNSLQGLSNSTSTSTQRF